MDLIVLVISIVLLLLLGISLLIGFFRNFKGNLCSLISVIVATTLCFLLYGLIAKLLKDISIAGYTVQQHLENLIAEALEVKKIKSSIIKEYTGAIAETIWRIPTFMVLLLISYSAIVPILKLILKKLIPLSNQKTTNIPLRIGGMFISFLSWLICFTVISAPMIAAVDVANRVYEATNTSKELRKDEAYQTLQAVEASPFVQFVNVYTGEEHQLQHTILGSMATIETSYGKINIVKNIDSCLSIVKLVDKFSDIEEDQVFNLIVENKKDIINILKKNDMIPSVMPLGVEILMLTNENPDLDFEGLKKVDWQKEISNIAELIEVILDGLAELEFDSTDMEKLLGNEKLPEVLLEIGETLNEGGSFRTFLLDFLNQILIDSLIIEVPESLEPIFNLMDLTKFTLSTDFETLGRIANLIYKIGVDDTSEIDYMNYVDEIGELIKLPFKLSVIADNSQLVLECLLEFSGVQEMLNENEIEFDYDEIDIKAEIDNLSEVITYLLRSLKYHGVKDLNNLDFETVFTEIASSDDSNVSFSFNSMIDSMLKSETLTKYLIDFISDLFDEYGVEWKSDAFVEIENTYYIEDKLEFRNSLKTLIRSTAGISDLRGLDLFKLSGPQLLKYKQLLKDLVDNKIININHVLVMLEDSMKKVGLYVELLDEMPDRNGDGSTTLEWNTEINTLFNILDQIKGVNFNNYSLQSYPSKIGNALNYMKTSYVFGNDVRNDNTITTDDNIFNKVIEQAFIKFGLLKPNNNNGILTVEEVRNEDWTTYNWVDEVNCLKCYNINEFDQSNYDLAQLQSSKIVKKFLDVAGMLNQRLSSLTYTIQGQTIVVSDYINDGLPLTNEDLASRSWSREANGIDDLKYALNGSSLYTVKNNLTVICTYGNDTYAKEAAAKILAVLNNI